MVAVGGLHPHLTYRVGRAHLPQQAPYHMLTACHTTTQQFFVNFAGEKYDVPQRQDRKMMFLSAD
jgi:hypothetical protein